MLSLDSAHLSHYSEDITSASVSSVGMLGLKDTPGTTEATSEQGGIIEGVALGLSVLVDDAVEVVHDDDHNEEEEITDPEPGEGGCGSGTIPIQYRELGEARVALVAERLVGRRDVDADADAILSLGVSNEEKARFCLRVGGLAFDGMENENENERRSATRQELSNQQDKELAPQDHHLDTITTSTPDSSKSPVPTDSAKTPTPNTRRVRFADETIISEIGGGDREGMSTSSSAASDEKSAVKLAKKGLERLLREKLGGLEERQAVEAESLVKRDGEHMVSSRNDGDGEMRAKEEEKVDNNFTNSAIPKARKPNHLNREYHTPRPTFADWRAPFIKSRPRGPLPIPTNPAHIRRLGEPYPDVWKNDDDAIAGMSFPSKSRTPLIQSLQEKKHQQTISLQKTHVQILEKSNEDAKAEIVKLKGCIEGFEETIREMAGVGRSARNEIDELENMFSTQSDWYSLCILEGNEKAMRLQKKFEGVENKYTAARKDIVKLGNELAFRDADAQDTIGLQNEISELGKRNEVLEVELQREKVTTKRENEAKDSQAKEIEQLTVQIQKQAEQILWAEDAMHRLDVDKKDLKSQLADEKYRHGTTVLSKASLENRLDMFERELDQSRRMGIKLIDEKNVSKWERESRQLEEKEIEISELKFQIRTAAMSVGKMNTSNTLALEELDVYKGETARQLARYSLLEHQLKTRLSDRETVITELQKQVSNQEQCIAGSEVEIAFLNSTVELLQHYHEQATTPDGSKIQNLNSVIENEVVKGLNFDDLENSDQLLKIESLKVQLDTSVQAKSDKVKETDSLQGYVKELQKSLGFEKKSNAEKADQITSLKDQLQTEMQEKKNLDFILEAHKGALRLEIEANTNKGKMIASLRADHAILDKENTRKNSLLFGLRTQYSELDEAWKVASADLTSRHLDLWENLEEHKKRSGTALCEKEDRIDEMREDFTEKIRCLQAGIKRKDELHTTISSEFSRLEKTSKAVEDKYLAMLKSSRDEIEKLKGERSTAKAISDKRREEHDKVVEILQKRDELSKQLEKLIASKDRSIDELRAEVSGQYHKIEVLKLENEGLRKGLEAMMWEEDAEDSDVASIGSQDCEDEIDDQCSAAEDLNETYVYEDLQADYESDMEREEEKSEAIDIEIVDTADILKDLGEPRLNEDFLADGENEEAWTVMSRGPLQNEATEQDGDDTFIDVASDVSDDGAVAPVEFSGRKLTTFAELLQRETWS